MTIVPNAFQTPNVYVDRAMQYLEPVEYMILSYAVRHIMGWQDKIHKRQGAISLEMFENGFATQDGKVYAGCGLRRMTIINTLKGLVKYGLLIRLEKTDNGQKWQLGDDSIDWDGLQKRKSDKDEANRKRTEKATARRKAKAGGTSDDTVSSDDTTKVSSDDTLGGTSDDTESKPLSKPSTKPISAPISAGANLLEQYVENHLTVPDDAPAEPSLDDKDSIQEPATPRNSLFDAVAQHVYKTDPALVKTDGGRIGAITAWLAGKSDGMKRGKSAKVVVGYISSPAKPEHVAAFMGWYEDMYPNISLRDFEKFVEYWRQWATEMNARQQRQQQRQAGVTRKERYL